MASRVIKALAVGVCGLVFAIGVGPREATAAELSEKSVKVLMNWAWEIVPDKFTTPTGKVIEVDKTKKDEVMVPVEVGRDIIKVARLSAHAQICKLPEKQIENYRTLMRQEEDKKKWTDQQLLYISQLHLFTVMWITGNVRLIEKDGENEVVVDEGEAGQKEQTCTDAQRKKVEEQIDAYVKTAATSQ
jgi:hypothetical protein